MRTTTRILVCVGAAMVIAGASHAFTEKEILLAWPLNEGAGDAAKDLGPNKNDGKLTGDAKWTDGKFGKGVQTQAKGHIKTAAANGVSPKYISECLWVNFNDLAPENQFGYIQSAGAASTRFFYFSTWCAAGPPHDCIHLGTVDLGGAWGRGIVTAKMFKTKEWYHVCGVINNEDGYIRAYVNGKMVHDQGFAKGDSPGEPKVIWAGLSSEDYQPLTGIMDEVIFFNAPITDKDIELLMKSGIDASLAVNSQGKLATSWGTLKTR